MDNFRRISLYTKQEAALNGKTMDELANLVPVTIKGVYIPVIKENDISLSLSSRFDNGNSTSVSEWISLAGGKKSCGTFYKNKQIGDYKTTNGNTIHNGEVQIHIGKYNSSNIQQPMLQFAPPNTHSTQTYSVIYIPKVGSAYGNNTITFNTINTLVKDSFDGVYYYLDLSNYGFGYNSSNVFHINIILSSVLTDNDTYPLYFVI